jgi:hypothetical protein
VGSIRITRSIFPPGHGLGSGALISLTCFCASVQHAPPFWPQLPPLLLTQAVA